MVFVFNPQRGPEDLDLPKTYGIEVFGRLIEQNIEQAAYVARLVQGQPTLELLAPVTLNVVCFRFCGSDSTVNLDAVNKEIVIRLQESGIAVPSMTRLKDQVAIRVAITNHRSQRADFDVLVEEVLRIGVDVTNKKLEELQEKTGRGK